jgi:hypothetical protein
VAGGGGMDDGVENACFCTIHSCTTWDKPWVLLCKLVFLGTLPIEIVRADEATQGQGIVG